MRPQGFPGFRLLSKADFVNSENIALVRTGEPTDACCCTDAMTRQKRKKRLVIQKKELDQLILPQIGSVNDMDHATGRENKLLSILIRSQRLALEQLPT